jgi:uncharacterized membrane protein
MPLIPIFILLVVLIAAFGFWDTIAAVLGGALMVILVAAVVVGLVALAGAYAWRRIKGRA